MATSPSFTRVHNQPLSLWQSAVAETVRQQHFAAARPGSNDWLAHPLVQATNVYAGGAASSPDFDAARLAGAGQPHNLVYLSQLGHQIGIAKVEGDAAREAALTTTYRQYSDKDTAFLTCATTYAEYYALSGGVMRYNDWTVAGKGNLNYGVIDYQLPNDATVGIIGDWGTGLADAKALLLDLMLQKPTPAAIIHLGDIYYSGTPNECQSTFVDIFNEVFDQVLGKGKRIPVFTLPGNHDYYAWGLGFYPMLRQLNTGSAVQEASYFCLRTADNGWQFLGMDSGYNDSNPADQVNPTYAGPWLQPSEITWHRDKLKNFPGATILLSHHQLFSANSKINGMASTYRDLPYFNPFLYKVVYDFLPTKVAGWLWGHEHNLVLFQNNLFGLSKGRLIGCSAYEELTSANPYTVNYPQVPYLLPPPQGQLGTNADPNGVAYYNHAYAIIDFRNRKNPTDAVNITYYEFPSWGVQAPPQPASKPMYAEQLALPSQPGQQGVMSGATIYLQGQEGLYVAPLYQQVQYYPTLNTSGPVPLTITRSGGSGPLQDGDTVYIQTLEPAAGKYNRLGAWSTPTLYYYTPGYKQQQWTLKKRDNTGSAVVNYGDEIYFVNQSYTGQVLTSYFSAAYGSIYLTTKANTSYYWTMQRGVAAQLPAEPAVAAQPTVLATPEPSLEMAE
jgi:hypothetical protein